MAATPPASAKTKAESDSTRAGRSGFRLRGPDGGWSWLAALAWLILLAILPWWLGLPLLLAFVAVLLVSPDRLGGEAPRLRRALRWGLPGLLFAAQRALGGDALAWALALLGALAGFTLLAGLEAWLDRALPRAPLPAAQQPSPDWPELARAPVGPPPAIIELEPPRWQDAAAGTPADGTVRWQPAWAPRGSYRVDERHTVDAVQPRHCLSPDGRWFAAPLARRRGVALLDRKRGQLHRLRGWDLSGWDASGPFLQRDPRHPPRALREVLGERNRTRD